MVSASMHFGDAPGKVAARIAAAIALAAALALGLAAPAFASGAVTATGVDYAGNGGVMDTVQGGRVQVAQVAGQKGDAVFLTLYKGDEVLAKNLAYTLGRDGDGAGDARGWHGLVTLDIAGFDDGALATGGYRVVLHSDRVGRTKIFDGKLYGVYAQVNGQKLLIGTRSVASAEAARGFNPPSVLHVDGAAYTTDGKQVSSTPAYTYIYSKGAAAGATVTGTVVFVHADETGESHEICTIEQQVGEDGVQVAIPQTVLDDEGNRYRTISSQDAVVLQNPGVLSFTIHCAKMEREDPYGYIAQVRMVDGDGTLLASDKVEVHGNHTYTAPKSIYRTETLDGVRAVVSYVRVGDGVVDLADDAVREAKGATITYRREDPESAQVEVTFNLLDGTVGPRAKGRVLGVDTQIASVSNKTVEPPRTVAANGRTYVLAGSPDDYAYAYRSGGMPVVNAYYTPEGHTPDSRYTVTVSYVNYANGQMLDSREFDSSPDDVAAIEVQAPERLQAEGDTFVRLEGQEALLHSYYSGTKQYTVYYRNVQDRLEGGITRVRVVYDQAPARPAQAASGGSAGAGSISGGVGASGASGSSASASSRGTAGSAGASDDDAADARLDQSGTYSAMDGGNGNGTLSNEAGTDSATERIADDETPLGQFEGEGDSGEDGGEGGFPGGAAGIAVAIAALAAGGVGIAVFLLRRRGEGAGA